MLQSIINSRIRKTEKDLGVNMDYLRHIAEISIPALTKFSKIQGLSGYRKKLSVEAHFVSWLAAAQFFPTVKPALNF